MQKLDSLTPDRRSFIGGAGLAAAPSRAAWEAAVANLVQRQAEMDFAMKAYNRAEARYFDLKPANLTIEDLFAPPTDSFDEFRERAEAVKANHARQTALVSRQTGYEAANRIFDIAMDRHTAALEALLLCPAPDVAAVAYKLEEAKRHGMDMFHIEGIMADIRRIAGEA